MGRRARVRALPRAGRGGHRDRLGRERDPVDAHRHGQVARRGRGARGIRRQWRAQLLHRAHQGPRQREVLPARRDLRRAERRHGHRRQLGEPRCPDHLLHGRDPRQPRPPPGSGCRGRPGGDGRVPLLRRSRPGLGVAGAAHHPDARAVHPHVGDPRRRHRDRRGPHPPHRPRDRPGDRRRPPGAAALLLREDARAGDRGGAPRDPPGARVHRALLAGRRDGAGAGPVVDPGDHARAARRDRRRDRRIPLHDGLRQDALAARARGHRRAPRGHAAALPPSRRDARAARAPPRHLRHRHAGRRHQRADPHGAHHRPREVRRAADAPAQRPRVPPGRRAGRSRRLRHGGHRRRARARARDRERGRRPQGGRRPEEAQEDRAQEGARRADHLGRGLLRAARRRRARTPRAAAEAHGGDAHQRDRPRR